MSARTRVLIIRPALLEVIKDGRELECMIHESLWDAWTQHGKKLDKTIIQTTIGLLLQAFSEECDTGHDPETGERFYLVPQPEGPQ